MNVALRLDSGIDSIPENVVNTVMTAYAGWVDKAQQAPDPNGIFTLGEPKYFVNDGRSGAVYDQPWGRPQNDGPGLRARTLVRYAHRLLNGTLPGGRQLVLDTLFHPGTDSLPIARDLTYVSQQWQQPSFDLWEEISGEHFFTLMVQRNGLLEGAALAEALNDSSVADAWRATAKDMEGAITSHWDEATGVVQETPPGHGGPSKYKELDCAVVLGALEGGWGDGFFDASDDRVLATASALQDALVGVYPLNAADDAAGLPGFLVGRYPNDTYDGYETGKVGNPWFICTHAFGELYYRQAAEALRTGVVSVTTRSEGFLRRAHSRLRAGVVVGGAHATASAPSLEAFVAAMVATGDGYLTRAKHHASGAKLHLSEQINLRTGFEEGANDLTWSYGTLLSAYHVRMTLNISSAAPQNLRR